MSQFIEDTITFASVDAIHEFLRTYSGQICKKIICREINGDALKALEQRICVQHLILERCESIPNIVDLSINCEEYEDVLKPFSTRVPSGRRPPRPPPQRGGYIRTILSRCTSEKYAQGYHPCVRIPLRGGMAQSDGVVPKTLRWLP